MILMSLRRLEILFIALFATITFSVGAQGLPALQKSPDVVTGSLPNGIQYYLVKNAVSGGFADFALVQKGAVSDELSRNSLTSLRHFQKVKPYQYLAKQGVGYKKYGYTYSDGYSTSFHFEDVPVSQQAVRDTVLLMLFDICETFPYSQAIVISGDIDPNEIRQRMGVFSMMVTPRSAASKHEARDWAPSETRQVRFIQAPPQDEATISFSWESARTPSEVMNTAQPLVSEFFARMLGTILTGRAQRILAEEDIALASTAFDYRSSADSPGPELYTFSATVSAADLEFASQVLARMLAELKVTGALPAELANAKQELIANAAGHSVLSNAQWVRKCSSAYLYGSNLASQKTLNSIFTSRNVPAGQEIVLFNDFVSALMNPEKGMSIVYEAPGVARDDLHSRFEAGWLVGLTLSRAIDHSVNLKDTVSLAVSKTKTKLKSTVAEPVTGGEMWTWSNGMKVIFKKSGSEGRFSYGFMLNGGLSEVPGLKQGEGGFIGDLLELDNVADFSANSFKDMLRINGISMDTRVTVSHLALLGSAPSSKAELLLKSLAAVANRRSVDADAYRYYRDCERLRISARRRLPEGIQAVVDSLMTPDYPFTESKLETGLTDDLQDRAEAYFERRFDNCHDGALVIVGDIDSNELKKLLGRYLGSFRTGQGSAVRPRAAYTMRSGWSTYTVNAEESNLGNGEPCVNVSISALMPFTADKYMAFKVAAVELKRRVAEALAETGMYAEVRDDFALYPSERLSLSISCHPSSAWGLPQDVVMEDPLTVLAAVRKALSELSSAEVPADVIKASKAALSSQTAAGLADPDQLVDVAMMRYSAGKDLVSGYKDKINAVSAAKVKEILSVLSDGAKVEFVIY